LITRLPAVAAAAQSVNKTANDTMMPTHFLMGKTIF
jgi:hypothetical protein